MGVAAILIQLIGIYCFYNRSQRAMLRSDKVSLWLQEHKQTSLFLGWILLFVSFVLLVLSLGWGGGILFGVIALMTLSGLVIVMAPL